MDELLQQLAELPFLQAEVFQTEVFGFTLRDWGLTLLVILAALLLARIVVRILTTLVRLRVRATGADYDATLYERLRGPIIVGIMLVGLGFALDYLPFQGFLATWRWLLFAALVGATIFWALLRIFVGRIRPGDIRSLQTTLVTRIALILYANVAGFLLTLQLIQWPIWCVPDCTAESLNNAQLVNMDLRNVNFVEADLTSVNLSGANLSGADLSGARMLNVNLEGADLRNATLIGADLRNVDLRGVNLFNADFSGANLQGANLTQANLTTLTLRGANLRRTILVEANLRNTQLRGTDLVSADLTGANLSGANLVGASISGATLSGANLEEANLGGVSANMADLGDTNLSHAFMGGASLVGARLSSANLQHAELEGAVLIGANLSGANLSGANLIGVLIFPAEFLDDTVLRLDPVLSSLNATQREQVLVTTSLGGVVFDDETIWPPSKQALLLDRLGQQIVQVEEEPPEATTTQTTAATPLMVSSERDVTLALTDFTAIRPIQFGGDGSPGLVPLSRALVERFRNQGYFGNISLEADGNDIGFERLCLQTISFIYTTRYIRDSERRLCEENNTVPVGVRVGTGRALAVVVNPLNTFAGNLTLDELEEALTLQRWSDVNPNYPPTPIRRLLPEPDTDSYNLLVEAVFSGDDAALLSAGNTLFDSNNSNLIWDLAGDETAIAVVDFDAFMQNRSLVRGLPVQGIAPTADGIDGRDYRLVQPVMIYTDLLWVREQFVVNMFVAFYVDQAPGLITGGGFTPLSASAVDRELRNYLLQVGGVVD